MKLTALYPGSFDPMTYGHIDILERATHMFDRVVVAVANNTSKKCVFSVEERLQLITECVNSHEWRDQVEIDHFTGLLVDYATKRNIHTLIRGVRQISDFEYEFRMALMNRRLAPKVDTLFLMPSEELTFVSASLVREVAYWDGELTHFVPDNVAKALRAKYAEIRKKEVK
ncbi:MAG TPA: pantetheine-phosphate adenylyltransferase [Balneolales bacterium]|nr:pantetheine-phosphate adenylyltransferase [Balneolales bacterium]